MVTSMSASLTGWSRLSSSALTCANSSADPLKMIAFRPGSTMMRWVAEGARPPDDAPSEDVGAAIPGVAPGAAGATGAGAGDGELPPAGADEMPWSMMPRSGAMVSALVLRTA